MINDDKKVLQEGRRNKLPNEVKVPLRDQIVKKLRKQLVEDNVGQKVADIWSKGNADRQVWLDRQKSFLFEFDEFLEPIYAKAADWSSNLHLPITLTVAKTYHARMYQALMGMDPPFTVRANQDANEPRVPLIQGLMRHAVYNWANQNQGVEETVDAWLWDWITAGDAIIMPHWETKYSRYVDVEKVQVPSATPKTVVGPDGSLQQVPQTEEQEQEVERVIKCFDGPGLRTIPLEDVLIVGNPDPQRADVVMFQDYLTASDLHTYVDRGVFDEDAVTKIIESGENLKAGEPVNAIKSERAFSGGEANVDKNFDLERFQIIECYMKMDVDGSGINSDIVLWVHTKTREILRATYLYRINPNGRIPFYRIQFHKRHGSTYGVGLVELLYTLSKEIDSLHNIRVDIGILTSNPFGFYRPTASITEEKLPVEPGILIPLDNPQADVYFPNFSNRTSWNAQEEQALMAYIERVTSMSDISYGSSNSQGAARTATGARALVGEANANLDIYIRRMNRGWRGVLTHLFQLIQQKMPEGFEFRILGDDGESYFKKMKSREEIAGMFDFELNPNSANSSPQINIDKAQQVYQMSGNMLDLQLGIVTPLERYEATRNLMQALGIQNTGRFLKKPQQMARVFSPEEMANRILAGMDVQMNPNEDLQGFVDYVDHLIHSDIHVPDETGKLIKHDSAGQFTTEAFLALEKKRQEAMRMLAALQQQQAQVANLQQQQQNANPQMGAQGNPVGGGATPQEAGGAMSGGANGPAQ